MSKDSQAASNLVCFLLGAAVGAAVALLYAPQEGETTRRIIGEKAGEVKDKASEVSHTVATNARDKWNVVREKSQEYLHRAKSAAEEKIEEVKEEIEPTAPA
jgi:gas vesicle protein